MRESKTIANDIESLYIDRIDRLRSAKETLEGRLVAISGEIKEIEAVSRTVESLQRRAFTASTNWLESQRDQIDQWLEEVDPKEESEFPVRSNRLLLELCDSLLEEKLVEVNK